MELNREQKEKLKNKLIGFCDELGDIIKDKGLDLTIYLDSNYNTYGGLVFKVHNNYFGYETNKTRFISIYSVNCRDKKDIDYLYNNWKYKDLYIDHYKDFMLDILMNKDRIISEVKQKIQYNDDLLDEILG